MLREAEVRVSRNALTRNARNERCYSSFCMERNAPTLLAVRASSAWFWRVGAALDRLTRKRCCWRRCCHRVHPHARNTQTHKRVGFLLGQERHEDATRFQPTLLLVAIEVSSNIRSDALRESKIRHKPRYVLKVLRPTITTTQHHQTEKGEPRGSTWRSDYAKDGKKDACHTQT